MTVLQHYLVSLFMSISENYVLSVINIFLTLVGGILSFLQYFDKRKTVKQILTAVLYTVVSIYLCISIVEASLVLVFINILLILVIFFSSRKSAEARRRIIKDILNEQADFPTGDSGLSASLQYNQARRYIKEKRPREAIECLRKCSGKITGQSRFFISYADALIQAGNPSGALAKLNALPAGRLNKRKTFIRVTIIKADCHHFLHEYAKELKCYNDLLARGIQPETFFLRRGQVKVRMLEVRTCLNSAEQAIAETSDSQDAFIDGIFEDLNKALYNVKSYSEQYEGEVLSYMGAGYIYASDLHKGLELLNKARKKNEFFPNTYIYLGICSYQSGDFTKAVKTLSKATSFAEHSDVSEMAYYYLAKTYYKLTQYSDAIKCAAQALSVFPYRGDCFEIQGDCYLGEIMYAEAIECYTNAIRLKPEARYYRKRAICHYNRKDCDYEKAYYDIQCAIKLEDGDDYRVSALIYKSALDREKGVRISSDELEELLALYKETPKYFGDLGMIYSNYQFFEEAQLCYKKDIENYPGNASSHYNFALLLKRMGRYEEAVENLKIAIDLTPMCEKFHQALINCYKDLGDVEKEVLAQCRLTEIKRRHSNVNHKNGDAVYRLGKYQAAVDYYKAGLECYQTPALLNNLACACYNQGKYYEAIKYLENAVKMDKSYFLAYYNLGNCQLYISEMKGENDMREAAEKNYQTTSRLNSKFQRAAFMSRNMTADNIEMIIDDTYK